MTEQAKQLLIKDLCARLPYNVKINIKDEYSQKMVNDILCAYHIGGISYNLESRNLRPYLRPMSSMTEEEKKYYNTVVQLVQDSEVYEYEVVDWLNAHQFDYRIDPSTGKTMIESGIALEAPEGMYEI